jgi:8-oxo-dGTP diphosphatase / 2-hydroxy-dATP diphosphatase
MKIICNLVFMVRGDEVLLGMKKRRFGAGLWNGYGGKVMEGESVEESAKREVLEESGVTANDLKARGNINFHFPDGLHMEVHVYSCTDFTGEPVETEEMRPQWFRHADVPYSQMWDDDKVWLPGFLAGKDVNAEFTFDADNKVLSYKLHDGQKLGAR